MALPDLILFEGDWDRYVLQIYDAYYNQVAIAGLSFRGLPIKCKFSPPTNGMGYGFWHLMSDGKEEDDRIPDLRRCERIPWVAWLVSNAETDDQITWWENKRGGNTHVVIWLESEDFAVVLAKRNRYYLLKTAYDVKPNRKRTFQKERAAYRSSVK